MGPLKSILGASEEPRGLPEEPLGASEEPLGASEEPFGAFEKLAGREAAGACSEREEPSAKGQEEQ
eukprot:7756322-Pyramimonas_sp.AAC.1